MAKFSVIETGGKQYKVSAGQKLKIEKIAGEAGEAVVFDRVLLKNDPDSMEIGQPYLSGLKVEGKIIKQARDKKKIVFRYHSKTRYRKKNGHRQPITEVEIVRV
ncbi:MAG: 50S ribosomal protein L21 [Candidatus Paceibacterota bacterium]|jgi:large subunit ribosomal protein L21